MLFGRPTGQEDGTADQRDGKTTLMAAKKSPCGQ